MTDADEQLKQMQRMLDDEMMRGAAMGWGPQTAVQGSSIIPTGIAAGTISTANINTANIRPFGSIYRDPPMPPTEISVRIKKAENGWIVSEHGSAEVYIAESLEEATQKITVMLVNKRIEQSK